MTCVRSDWLEHRRASDRERLGWLRSAGDGWAAVDLLGRDVTGEVSLSRAEEALEELGLGYLAEKWELEHDDGRIEPVRLVEVTPELIRFKSEDYGDMSAPVIVRSMPWPAPAQLRPRR